MEQHKVNIVIMTITSMMNDNNAMCATVWFEIFGGYFNVKIFDVWEVNVT